ncbi:MAG: tRNA(Ile)-lysidine synthetase, partial [Deltaproteobacteria bacterium]|nr:tRNA(Ile)-lysidine synthetase [Deltaproteobacteria bacterium]
MNLETKVRETIQKYGMLTHGDGVLVAVSGGADSVVLLHLLSGLKEELGLRLEVAHLQHGIRGEEAREDALFVANMAERLALPFHLRDIDLPKMRSEKGKGNIEAMAREERYRFFVATAEEHGIHKVATA